jgi:hypothetical protein
MANLPGLTQIKWPLGNVDSQQITQAQYTAGFIGANASGSNGQGTAVPAQLWIQNNKTLIEISALTAAFSINLAIDPKLQDGSELTIRLIQGPGPFAVTPGTGFEAATPVSPVVASKTDCINAVLRNGVFVFVGGWSNVR